jgi:hypothetical protein
MKNAWRVKKINEDTEVGETIKEIKKRKMYNSRKTLISKILKAIKEDEQSNKHK